jgi:hypothetical protein
VTGVMPNSALLTDAFHSALRATRCARRGKTRTLDGIAWAIRSPLKVFSSSKGKSCC